MDEGTTEFAPLVDNDEVDDRPFDDTDGWPEHEESEDDPLDPDPPQAVVTILDEEMDDDAS